MRQRIFCHTWPGLCVAVLIGTLPACSQSTPGTATAATGKPSAATPKISGNVCDLKLLSAADLVGVLDQPVNGTKSLPGDAQTCIFTSGTEPGAPQLSVSLRAGLGRATIASFTSGHMDEYSKWQTLAGVGDGAVWLPQLHEVQAQQDDVLCNVHPDVASAALGHPPVQQKLGALCNTIFTRLNLPHAAAAIGTTPKGNVLDDACAKDIAPADVADIVIAPVVRQGSKLNPQSCSYHAAAGATVTISLSQGEDGKTFWDMMSNPANVGTLSPLAGIGDSALHARGGTQVIARKGDLVCSVDITGTDNADGMQVITKARDEELAKKLGALCGKVFAARG